MSTATLWNERRAQLDLRQYLQAVRKFWWVMLIPLVVGMGAGVLLSLRSEPVYRGSVTYFVKTLQDAGPNAAFQGDQFAQRRVNSYVALLSSDRLAASIVERSGVDLTPRQVSDAVGATGDLNTVLLTATVTTESRELTSTLTDALALEFVLLVDAVENPPGEDPSVNLEVVSGPTVQEVAPRRTLVIGFAAAVGLLIGLGLALLLELRDTSVRNEDQLIDAGAGPVLARIPLDRQIEHRPLALQSDGSSLRAEAFRQLRTNLQFIDLERSAQVVVVTSAIAGDGKSSTVANLSIALAAAGQRVLAIEADFRRPHLADHFDVERAVGLSDVLAGTTTLEQVVQPWGNSGVAVLPSGHLPPNPSELLGGERMARLIEKLRAEYDAVLIDTPPLVPVTDAAVLSTRADGVLLVVRCGRTSRHQLAAAVRSLSAVGAVVLGSVLSAVPGGRGSAYTAYQTTSNPPPYPGTN